jgi:TonB-linked SusC/RagA family outer membrane protein
MKKWLMLLSMCIAVVSVYAQERVVTGKVTDEKGSPLENVTISAKGSSTGVVSKADGSFRINVPASVTALQASAVGMESVEVVIPASNTVSFVLKSTTANLEGVVVVAYGQQKKNAVTGSVTSISADKIEKQQVVSVGQALQGLASGVLVINSTGQPGENPIIRIRGIGSVNASAAPLVVIDGIPFDGNLSNINPNDIESMNVLKDATATALYGSRAANGVILLTTKTGKKGKDAAINVYSSYGVTSRAVKEYPFVTSEQYMKLSWEALKNQAVDQGIANPGQYATDNLIGTLKYNPYNVAKPIDVNGNLVSGAQLQWNTDWSKEIQNDNMLRKNVGLNIAGGSDKLRYFLSGDYLNQDGYVIKSNFKRISARLNVDADLRKWLTVGLKSSVSSSNQNYPDQSGTAFRNAVQFGRMLSSIYPLYQRGENGELLLDANGNPMYDYGFSAAGRTVNVARPVAQGANAIAIQMLDKTLYERLLSSINTYGEVKLAKDLKFRSSFGIDRYVFTGSTYQNPLYGDAASIRGRVGKERDLTTSWTWNNMLTYEKKFGDHTIGAMASSEAYDYKYEFFNAQKTGFPAPDLTELGPGSTLETINSYTNRTRLVSYLGRATYNYRNKYFLEATLRRDGSSRFLDDKRWGTFYAVGGSWLITQDFLKNVKFLDQLKLRASYGEVGNNALASYFPYLSAYSTGYNDLTNPGTFLTGLGNESVTWEKLGTYNIGLDFSFLKNRINGSIDYYNKKTFDLLFRRPLPGSSGITGVDENIGEVTNKGVELNLNTRNIVGKNFTWETNFNLATVKNTITKLPQQFINSGAFRLEVGQSLNSFFIYEWAGVDAQTGKPMWYADEKDASGNLTGKKITVNGISTATKYYAGTALPKVTGGLSNNFTYKSFDVSVLLNYAFGGKILDADYIGLMHGMSNVGYQLHTDILNRWQNPGDITDVPRLSLKQSDYGNPSTRHLVSGDYVRLRNVTLGFNLPSSLIGKQDVVKSLRLYVQGDNMLTWTKGKQGLDPEVNITGQTGQSSSALKTFSVGLNVGF